MTDAGELQGLGKGAMELADCTDEEESVDSGEELAVVVAVVEGWMDVLIDRPPRLT